MLQSLTMLSIRQPHWSWECLLCDVFGSYATLNAHHRDLPPNRHEHRSMEFQPVVIRICSAAVLHPLGSRDRPYAPCGSGLAATYIDTVHFECKRGLWWRRHEVGSGRPFVSDSPNGVIYWVDTALEGEPKPVTPAQVSVLTLATGTPTQLLGTCLRDYSIFCITIHFKTLSCST